MIEYRLICKDGEVRIKRGNCQWAGMTLDELLSDGTMIPHYFDCLSASGPTQQEPSVLIYVEQ